MNLLEAKTFKDNIKKLPFTKGKISDILHNNTAKNISDNEAFHIRKYSSDSKRLNNNLITNGVPNHDDEITHKIILKHAKPLGEKIHFYSGISNDLHNKIMLNQNKTFISPAHISMTHDPYVAKGFATYDSKNGVYNDVCPMIHIETKPSDKGLHISKYSKLPYEHETVIPSGTVLKHLKTTNHIGEKGDKYIIHHMSIHSQE